MGVAEWGWTAGLVHGGRSAGQAGGRAAEPEYIIGCAACGHHRRMDGHGPWAATATTVDRHFTFTNQLQRCDQSNTFLSCLTLRMARCKATRSISSSKPTSDLSRGLVGGWMDADRNTGYVHPKNHMHSRLSLINKQNLASSGAG